MEKEGSEQKAVKVNMFTGVQHSRWNLLAAKEDFRTNNSQYLLQTGFLGEDLNADNVYLSLNLVPEDSVGDPDHSSVEVETSLHMNMEAVVEFSDHLESGQNNSTRSERSGLSLSSRSGERVLLLSPPPPSSSQSPLDTLLDPDQELRPPRPLKVKATRSLPPSMKAKKKPSGSIIPISQFLSQQMQPTERQIKSRCLPTSRSPVMIS